MRGFNWDFPFGFLPTTSVGSFGDSLSAPHVCKSFFQSTLGFFMAQGTLRCDLRLFTRFSTRCEDTFSVILGVLLRLLSLFLHPATPVGNLRRSIASRMALNNSRGTATSAIWKIICREWRTTFAPILISFSRNVVNVQ